jgi:hypothetical protein
MFQGRLAGAVLGRREAKVCWGSWGASRLEAHEQLYSLHATFGRMFSGKEGVTFDLMYEFPPLDDVNCTHPSAWVGPGQH